MITLNEFQTIEIKIGTIRAAKKVEGADRLLELSVDLGEETPRTIVSGIAETFTAPEDLVGVQCSFVANLEPRTIRGIESQGMILALHGEDGRIVLLKPSEPVPAGTQAG